MNMENTKLIPTRVMTGRKPYHKPQMETVSLRPKETVLGTCKSISNTSNVGGTTGCLAGVQCLIDI